jgi:hypothetical protein
VLSIEIPERTTEELRMVLKVVLRDINFAPELLKFSKFQARDGKLSRTKTVSLGRLFTNNINPTHNFSFRARRIFNLQCKIQPTFPRLQQRPIAEEDKMVKTIPHHNATSPRDTIDPRYGEC